MAEKENCQGFHYTYDAQEQAEVEAIRKKYVPAEQDKLAQLRALDKAAERPGTAVSIAVGLLGLFLLGLGLCCILVWENIFALGLVLGFTGLVLMAIPVPLHRVITERSRKKMAPQILSLADELLH